MSLTVWAWIGGIGIVTVALIVAACLFIPPRSGSDHVRTNSDLNDLTAPKQERRHRLKDGEK